MVMAAFLPVAALIFYIAEEQKGFETAVLLDKTRALAPRPDPVHLFPIPCTRTVIPLC